MLLVKLDFLSYWRIKKHFKIFLKYIYFFFYLLQSLSLNIWFNFYKSFEKKKIFTFVKSPKCYKRGKRLYKFSFYKYSISANINKLIVLKKDLFLFFIFFKQFFIKLSTLYFFQHRLQMQIHANLIFLDFLC